MREFKQYHCPVELSVDLLRGKWKPMMLWYLSIDVLHYNELLRRLNGITPKMLSQQLKELESDHLIMRNVIDTSPPKVEYQLSNLGKK